MADQRQFVLIGDFTDNITPALDGINQAIGRLKTTMAGMSTKKNGGFADVTQSVGKLVSSQKHLAESIKEVGKAAREATADLKEYKKVVGKVASAHYHIGRSTKQAGDKVAQGWKRAEDGLTSYANKQNSTFSKIRKFKGPRVPRGYQDMGGGPPQPPRVKPFRGGGDAQPPQMRSTGRGMGGGERGPRPPRGDGGYGRGYDFHMGAFAFGMTLGQGISQPITTAIFSGFQMGVGLMSKTMQYVQSSFMERVEDQMTDLQAAGGYYSISKRQKDPMFSSLQSAIMFTQKTNDVLERLASDLPGSTEDYVKVSKRIGDSVMRVVDANEKGAIAFAKALVEKGGLQESYRGVSLEGPGAREGATQVILGELTKKTVLSGFGGSVGRGGAAGAYGLPALMERLITNPDTSMAQLQKYASVFGDPKIMSALERAMPKLKAAGADMLKRTMLINDMLDEIAPPEMIAAMRKSMAGVMEAYRSAFFSPGTGLFGFGRKLQDASGKMQPLTDVYGRFIRIIEKNGKQVELVVEKAEDAEQVDMSVFDMFADIVSNFAAVLKPIVDNLSLLWDPMQSIANALRQARIVSTGILKTFRTYTQGIEDFAKQLPENLREKFLSTKSFRATLLTISNLFTQMGIFSETDFYKFRKDILNIQATPESLGKVLKSFVDTFFKSDAAYQVGKFFGGIVKAFADTLSDLTGFFANLGTTKLAQGFMAGLGDDGMKVITKIFTDIYTLLFDAIKAIIPLLPWQVLAAGAAGLILPAVIAGIGMSFSQFIGDMLRLMGDKALEQLAKAKSKGAGKVATDAMGIADEVAEVTQGRKSFAKNAREVAEMGAPTAPKKSTAKVTSSGIKGKDLRDYTREIRKGESYGFKLRREGKQVRSFDNYTAKGTGITESLGTSKAGLVPGAGAKVTQGLGGFKPPKPPKPDPKWKTFSKRLVGVGGKIESVLGRSLLDFLKKFQNFFANIGPSIKTATDALGGVGPKVALSLTGLVTFLKRVGDFVAGNGDFLSGAKGAPGAIKPQAALTFAGITTFFKQFGEKLAKFTTSIAKGGRDFVKSFFKVFTSIGSFYVRVVEGNINLLAYVQDLPGQIAGKAAILRGKLGGFRSALLSFFDEAIIALSNLPKALPALGGKISGAVKGVAAGVANAPAIAKRAANVERLAGAAKALPVRIVGFAKGATRGGAGQGGAARSLIRQRTPLGAATRGAARVGQAIKNPMKTLGKAGGIATAAVGIVETIGALLRGEDLASALGEGAGPVIGTIIGTALLGPLGGIIGGIIGDMKSVTDALGESFRAIFGAFEGLGSAIMSLGGLIGDVISSILRVFGDGGEVDGIGLILAPLTLAFQALEVGIKGLDLLIEQIRVEYLKRFGTGKDYQEAVERKRQKEINVETAKARADVYNDSLRGPSALRQGIEKQRKIFSTQDIKDPQSAYIKEYVANAQKKLADGLNKENSRLKDQLKTDKSLNSSRELQILNQIKLNKTELNNLEKQIKTRKEIDLLTNKKRDLEIELRTNTKLKEKEKESRKKEIKLAEEKLKALGATDAQAPGTKPKPGGQPKETRMAPIDYAGQAGSIAASIVNQVQSLLDLPKKASDASKQVEGGVGSWFESAPKKIGEGLDKVRELFSSEPGKIRETVEKAFEKLTGKKIKIPGVEEISTTAQNYVDRFVEDFNKKSTSIKLKSPQIGAAITEAITDLRGSFDRLTKWFGSLKPEINRKVDELLSGLGEAWNKLTSWFTGSGPKVQTHITTLLTNLNNAWNKLISWFSGLGSKFSSKLPSITSSLNQATDAITNALVNWFKSLPGIAGSLIPGLGNQNGGNTGNVNDWYEQPGVGWFNRNTGEFSATKPAYAGSLGDAVSSEMKNKPPGSDLVVANSSETIIPAAGGLGMEGFINTLSKGFSTINQQYVSVANGLNTTQTDMQRGFQQVETQNQDQYNETTARINKFQEQTGNFLTSISKNILDLFQKVELMSSMGGMFGGMGGMDLGGGYGSAGVAIAGQLGNYIKSTGGAPGSIWEHPMHGGVKGKHAPGSYHYSGRAIDIGAYANEQAGVIARIKAFNAQMGVKPVEFLHAGNDPNHQDHVHVAYALGPNNGRMFTNLSAARSWEESMVPGSVKVASITGNSGEGFGGETNVVNNFTITQQPGEDGEALANRIATLFYDAMNSNSSIFV